MAVSRFRFASRFGAGSKLSGCGSDQRHTVLSSSGSFTHVVAPSSNCTSAQRSPTSRSSCPAYQPGDPATSKRYSNRRPTGKLLVGGGPGVSGGTAAGLPEDDCEALLLLGRAGLGALVECSLLIFAFGCSHSLSSTAMSTQAASASASTLRCGARSERIS